jgi:hypothetical protein
MSGWRDDECDCIRGIFSSDRKTGQYGVFLVIERKAKIPNQRLVCFNFLMYQGKRYKEVCVVDNQKRLVHDGK